LTPDESNVGSIEPILCFSTMSVRRRLVDVTHTEVEIELLRALKTDIKSSLRILRSTEPANWHSTRTD